MLKIKTVLITAVAAISLSACMGPCERHATDMHRSYNTPSFRGEAMSRNDVSKVQRSLTREGFYKGNIDGIWGEKTSQAILDYQAQRNPGQSDVTVDTLQEFGVKMDDDYYRTNRILRSNG